MKKSRMTFMKNLLILFLLLCHISTSISLILYSSSDNPDSLIVESADSINNDFPSAATSQKDDEKEHQTTNSKDDINNKEDADDDVRIFACLTIHQKVKHPHQQQIEEKINMILSQQKFSDEKKKNLAEKYIFSSLINCSNQLEKLFSDEQQISNFVIDVKSDKYSDVELQKYVEYDESIWATLDDTVSQRMIDVKEKLELIKQRINHQNVNNDQQQQQKDKQKNDPDDEIVYDYGLNDYLDEMFGPWKFYFVPLACILVAFIIYSVFFPAKKGWLSSSLSGSKSWEQVKQKALVERAKLGIQRNKVQGLLTELESLVNERSKLSEEEKKD